MSDEIKGNEISLLVTSAEVTSVTIEGSNINVRLNLMAGQKVVTDMSLGSWVLGK